MTDGVPVPMQSTVSLIMLGHFKEAFVATSQAHVVSRAHARPTGPLNPMHGSVQAAADAKKCAMAAVEIACYAEALNDLAPSS